jgi:arylsulfatase A-like enzyme
MPTKLPNIVLFNPDSYRGDVLGHLGNAGAVTPHLDALVARDGVSYAQAFAQNPVCTPSRCSFMTGWYPHVHGHRSMRHMLRPYEPSLLSVLRQHGYHVWWGGKNDLVQVHQRADYLKYCDERFDPHGKYPELATHRMPPPLPPDDPRHGAFYRGVCPRTGDTPPYWDFDTACVQGAIDMLRSRPQDRPFCCFLPLHNPHPAYFVEQEYYDRVDPGRLPPRLPTPPPDAHLPPVLDALRAAFGSGQITDAMWREAKHVYYAMCTKLDTLFGRLVEALRAEGLYDDTWILFFSDHGDFTGDYGLPEKTHSTLQDCLLRVPLVIKPPAGVPLRPGVRHHLAELVDITATLYDVIGLEPGYAHQGCSLRHSLAGTDAPLRDAVYAEVGGRRGETAFVNTDVHKLPPASFYSRQSKAAIPYHEQGSHAVMVRTQTHKYVRRRYTGHHELFDLVADPRETRNLAGQPQAAIVERELETRLLDFLLHTADVLPLQPDSRQV